MLIIRRAKYIVINNINHVWRKLPFSEGSHAWMKTLWLLLIGNFRPL